MHNMPLDMLYEAMKEIRRNSTNRNKSAMCSGNLDIVSTNIDIIPDPDPEAPEYYWCLRCGTKVYDEIRIVFERECKNYWNV